MDDSDVMPFGKYHGEELQDVPAQYLLWLFDQPWLEDSWSELHEYISDRYEQLISVKKSPQHECLRAWEGL